MRIKFAFLCLMLVAALSANVLGAHVYWQGLDDDFAGDWNWDAGFPTTADIGVMNNSVGAVLYYNPPYAMGELWMGGAPGVTASITASTGQIDVMNWVIIGQGYGGDPDAVPGGSALVDLSGDAVFNQVAGGGGDTHIAESSGDIVTTGTLKLSGSAIYNNNHGRFNVGQNTGALGTVTISGSATLNLCNEWHQLGFTGGVAQITQDGGTVNVNSSAAPEVSDPNGWCSVGHLIIGGWGGSGTWDMSGGEINAAGGIVLSDARTENPNTYGVLNLDGGTVTAPGIQAGFGWDAGAPTTAELNLNGGVIKANISNPDYIHAYSASATMTVNVKANGAIIDTNGFDVGINVPLLDGGGGGGLVKTGLGSLKLNGLNTYTGLTQVLEGTLGGSGTLGAVSVASGAGMAPGDPMMLTVGDITFNDDSYLDIVIDGALNDQLNSTGTLTLGAGVDLNVSLIGAPVVGNYDVLNWLTKVGEFTTVNLPSIPNWTITYDSATGIVSIVPEPATWVLLLVGGLFLMYRRFR